MLLCRGCVQLFTPFSMQLKEQYEPHSSFLQTIIDYRKVSKRHQQLIEYINHNRYSDGRLHPSHVSYLFHASCSCYGFAQSQSSIFTSQWQYRSATGRISTTDPNLQSTPNDFEFQLNPNATFRISMRSLFAAAEGHVLVSADYRQLEARVLGEDKVVC